MIAHFPTFVMLAAGVILMLHTQVSEDLTIKPRT
jgi:hypothetical protein